MSKQRKDIESLLAGEFRRTQTNLFNAYTATVKELKRDLKDYMVIYDDLSYSKRLEVVRMQSLLQQMENQLDILSGVQEEHVFKYLDSVGHTAYNELFYEFEKQNGFEIIFNRLPNDVLQTIVNRPIAGIRLSDRLNDGVITELKANLSSVLFRGFGRGDSYQKMARALADVAESSYKRALRIMRTEGGRVTAVTRQKSQDEAVKRGIDLGKQWVSTLDKFTRDSHQELDGQTVKVDEYFEVNGHKALQPQMFGVPEEDINCRCRTISVIKGYEPTIRRDNESGELVKYKNYKEWAENRL